MKFYTVLFTSLLMVGCATNEPINSKLAANNIALVKNTVFNPILSIKTKSTRLIKIDGKSVEDKNSHEVSAGKHKFFANCKYYETASLVLTGVHEFEVDLKKGHTYQLKPVPARNKKTNKPVCVILIKDLTKI